MPMSAETDLSGRTLRRSALYKGQQTRAAILDAALGLASHVGLEGLSIGLRHQFSVDGRRDNQRTLLVRLKEEGF